MDSNLKKNRQLLLQLASHGVQNTVENENCPQNTARSSFCLPPGKVCNSSYKCFLFNWLSETRGRPISRRAARTAL